MGRVARQAALAAREVRSYWRSLMGDDLYERYLDHRGRTHPGEPVLSERDYWRMRHTATEANPQTRCC
jgi:uncharacterized short protein YbdD (DUF466 family)